MYNNVYRLKSINLRHINNIIFKSIRISAGRLNLGQEASSIYSIHF